MGQCETEAQRRGVHGCDECEWGCNGERGCGGRGIVGKRARLVVVGGYRV